MPRGRRPVPREALARFKQGEDVEKLQREYGFESRAFLWTVMDACRHDLLEYESVNKLLIGEYECEFHADRERKFETTLQAMNTEIKHGTLILLDDYPQTASGVRRDLINLAGTRFPETSTFLSYFTEVFCPGGFATRKAFGSGLGVEQNYFSVSTAGKRFGQPVAAFSLRYAVDHDMSLYNFLGPVSSTGDSRAPYNRARIIETLSRGNKSVHELAEELGLSSSDVCNHLRRMQQLGLLVFDSIHPGVKKNFEWVNGKSAADARTVGELKTPTQKVARWLAEHGNGDYTGVAKAIDRHPNEVSTVLNGLVGQGLCYTRFPSTERSVAVLREGGIVPRDYYIAVRAALDGGTELDDMTTIANEFRRDRDLFGRYLRAAIELYSAVSPMLNSRTADERELELVSVLRGYETQQNIGTRPVEISQTLGWNSKTTDKCIKSLVDKGALVKVKRKGEARYKLAS